MKAHLIKTLFILITTIVNLPCFAQENVVTFNYDANGNRIARQIEIGRDNGNTNQNRDTASPSYDAFETLSVTLYPNPTEDQFSIAIEGNREGATLHAILTSSAGAILYDKTFNDATECFDLKQQSAGIYLLRLTAGDESHVWKVIKK
jgi:hypothetical protein